MLPASRHQDASMCASCAAVAPAARAAANVHTNARGALRLGDGGSYTQCCTKPAVPWVATAGAATVLINNEPAAAMSLATTHVGGRGALIGGSGNVLVGGAVITTGELARVDALAMIDKGLQSLDRWNTEDRRHFKEWFGTDSEWARELMRERLLQMREKLLHEELVPGTKTGTYAHVYPFTNTVNLDARFWSAPRTGADSRAGTLIHETSHFWGAGGTDDIVYGQPGCKTLAKQSPSKALNNADNHEYWLETLP
jgi:uncharacterized Zn-binding protein involved in type VI secretion